MNFVVNICGCETKWTAENIIEDAVARIKAQVGDDEVILGLSGGVDSSVVALLLHRAIGKTYTVYSWITAYFACTKAIKSWKCSVINLV